MTDNRTLDDIIAVILAQTIFAASIVDWRLTVIGLGQGAVELNPLMAPFFAAGPLQALAVKALAPVLPPVLMYAGLRRDAQARKWALATLLACALIGIAPVVWNLVQLGRHG